jgi:predicted AlkP superfamily phosphohydrolase/phosphomutase
MKKIIIISLDGASWKVLGPLVRMGFMPFTAEAIDKGCHGILNSVIPPVTASAWSSFMTGKLPDKHGVFEFRCFDAKRKADYLTNSSYIQSETVWQILSRHDKNIISINVPYTYPVYNVNGILISGMETPSEDSNYCSPLQIKEIIKQKFPDYIPAMKAWEIKDVSTEDKAIKYIDKLYSLIDLRVKLTKYLLSKHEWDVSMVHFQETDYIQHVLWDKIIKSVENDNSLPLYSKIREFYSKIDNSLKELSKIASTDETTFIIVSDHGCTDHRGIIYPNTILDRAELLVKLKNNSFISIIKKGIKNSKNPLLRTAYNIQKDIRDKFIANTEMTVQEKLLKQCDMESLPVVWDNSRAVAVMGSQYSFIYVKDKKDINKCKELLRGVKDPETGHSLFEKVITLDEAYNREGSRDSHMIVAIPEEGYSVSRVFKDPEFSTNCYFPGIHNQDGVYIAWGKDIKKGEKDKLNLIDVVPTCLYLLDMPVPRDMDGKVAHSLVMKEDKPKFEDSDSFSQQIQEYDDESKELIKERLRALGYI